LSIVDDCTRECPVIEVDTWLGGLRVRRVLDRIALERGRPEAIVVDNGLEFRGRALAAWSEERGVRLEFIQPGKPVQNAYIESFDRRLCSKRGTSISTRVVHAPPHSGQMVQTCSVGDANNFEDISSIRPFTAEVPSAPLAIVPVYEQSRNKAVAVVFS
jgi:transposase InsO family protein